MNPFKFGPVVKGDYFTDRENEINFIRFYKKTRNIVSKHCK